MPEYKTLAFDLETIRLASEVAEIYADELEGKSPWTRPNLFGFGCGVVLDLGTNVSYRYRDAAPMISHLGEANKVISYNGENFDLGVLSAAGNVSSIREKHIDINVLVMVALDELPIDLHGGNRIRQGGLDGLARANGLSGKAGEATAAPALLREGCYEQVFDYCEHDARLVADLYRIARQTGKLCVNGYTKVGGERIELGRLEVPIEIPKNPSGCAGSYSKNYDGEEVTLELWRPEDFATHVREEAPQGAVCGCIIVSPDIDYLVFEASQHDSEVNMIPDWAEEERRALVMSKLLGVSVVDSKVLDAYWLKSIPVGVPPEFVEKLRKTNQIEL